VRLVGIFRHDHGRSALFEIVILIILLIMPGKRD
jgi:hypothetical protein